MFAFNPFYALHEFYLWQFFTYSAVIAPDIWNAVSIVMLAIFGRDVEKFLGRRSFAWLFALVLVAAPAILSAFALLGVPVGPMAGTNLLNFAIFIAFVLIYPTAEIFFSIQARWIGLAAIGIYTLQLMAAQSWVSLVVMWGSCFVGALWLAREGVSSCHSSPSRPSASSSASAGHVATSGLSPGRNPRRRSSPSTRSSRRSRARASPA